MKQPFAVSFAARIAGAAVLLGFAMSASAAPPTTPSTVLFGGGATLPGIAYVGATNAHPDASSTAPRLTTGGAETDGSSVFFNYNNYYNLIEGGNSAAQTVPTISYCQTGSGAGKKVLNGTSGFAANTACPAFGTSTSSSAGFGGCTTGCNAGNNNAEGANNQFGADPAFAASDAPISQSEYSAFNTNKGATRTEPVQFPVIAGSIAIIYNNSTVPSSTQLNFSDKDVCLIFSGKVVNWNDARLSFHSVVGATSKPIVVAYRSDGSGTTFGFSNHLANVCQSVDSTDFTGSNHFDTSQNFNVAASATGTPYVISGLATDPTGASASNCSGGVKTDGTTQSAACFQGASGNSKVVATVGGNCTNGSLCTLGRHNGVDGGIGYAEAANAVQAQSVNGIAIAYGKVGSFDPLKDFPPIFTQGQLAATDQVINGVASSTNGAANVVALSSTPANPNCIWIVDPATYSAPSGQYPIMAVSYLLANNTGNGADANNIARLLTSLAVGGLQAAETGIGNNGTAPTGFAFLALTDSAFNTVDPSVFAQAVSHCVQP